MLYLTDNSTTRIKKWLSQNPGKKARLSIKTAGCTGFMYEVLLDEKFNIEDDFAIKYDDFDILVEHKYFHTIDGATLDYVTDTKSMSSHFELVSNPNEKARCGCGESFTV
jgi:iron-sulfur cluster assembly protein|tara:strand:+ start:179 stop:508 length:330 start_codon:yes stop_codon:yes gene_type:complete